MKVSDAKKIIDQDIENLEAQMAFLQGNMAHDPEIDINDLASYEFIEDLKNDSVAFDTLLWHEDVSEAEYSVWFYKKYGSDPKIELDDGEEYWTPLAVNEFERF